MKRALPYPMPSRPKPLEAKLTTAEGHVLVSYRPEKPAEKTVPNAAQPAPDPKDIQSIEQLYLTGLHIEQYRHATYKATDYYSEALRREPGDVRNNNAMGLWYLRRGRFSLAEPFFRTAIATLTQRNPNPYDGEPYFNLGICLSMQEKFDEAFDVFYKSTWNSACQDGAYLNLARIACRKANYTEALELIGKSLVRNYHSHTARHLKTAILRKLGRTAEAKHGPQNRSHSTPSTSAACMKNTDCIPKMPAHDSTSCARSSATRAHIHRIRFRLCPRRALYRSGRLAETGGRGKRHGISYGTLLPRLVRPKEQRWRYQQKGIRKSFTGAVGFLLPQPRRRRERVAGRHDGQPQRRESAVLPRQLLVCKPPVSRSYYLLGTLRAT